MVRIILGVMCLWTAVHGGEANHYVYSAASDGAPRVVVSAVTKSFASNDEAIVHPVIRFVERRREFMAAGKKEDLLNMYRAGEARATAEADFADWPALVARVMEMDCVYRAVISMDDCHYVFVHLGKKGSGKPPRFPMFQCVVGDVHGEMKVDAPCSFSSFPFALYYLTTLKQGVVQFPHVEGGMTLRIEQGKKASLLKGDAPRDDASAYVWMRPDVLPAPLALQDARQNATVSQRVRDLIGKVIDAPVVEEPKSKIITPMGVYQRLLKQRDSCFLVACIEVDDGELMVLESHGDGQHVVLHSGDTPPAKIHPLAQLLNMAGIPEVVVDDIGRVRR